MTSSIWRDAPMTAEREDELLETIQGMQKASNAFYAAAIQLHCHPFIEFTGMLNQYIQMCRAALGGGIDFTGLNTHSGRGLPMSRIDSDYIFEKFDCIYGPSLRSMPDAVDSFTEALHLTRNDNQ